MSVHDSHRKRLDRRVMEHGFEMLEPHEQLEHLLFAVIPRGDTNAVAHKLLETYGSVAAVLNADPQELEKVEGVGSRTAMFLTELPQLLGVVERNLKMNNAVRLETTRERADFAKTFFYGKMVENAYMFSLNSSYRLLRITRISEGVGSETAVFPQKVVRQALCDQASVVIIVHNHPLGIINPSSSDTEMTRKLYLAFEGLDIVFDDSLIISGEKYFSMRDNGYMDPSFLEYERKKLVEQSEKKKKELKNLQIKGKG